MTAQDLSQRGPKYAQVVFSIKRGIADGRFPPGTMLESEKQLCERFGISRGPVRQALDMLERDQWINRVPGSGSFVLGKASETPPKQRQVNILFDTSAGSHDDNFVVLEMIEGLNRAVAQLDTRYRLNYRFCRFEEQFAANPASPLDIFADDGHGLLVIPFTEYSTQTINRHQPTQTPVVSFFDQVDNPAVSQVYLDHQGAARRATELLLQFGHRRIGLLTRYLPSRKPAVQQRHAGYQSAVEAQGDAEPTIVETGGEAHSVRQAVHELLDRPNRPTALLATGGNLTTPMMQAVNDVGLSVPGDLSLIATDDTTDTQVHQPPLSVIKQPLMLGVYQALRMLLERIDEPLPKPQTQMLEPELVMRGSCAVARTPQM